MTAPGDWASLREDYLAALGTGDRARALGLVRGLRAAGHGVLTIVTELLAPAQRRVGELWVEDAWSVAQEHAATAVSEAALHALAVDRDAELSATGVPEDAPLVVVSCVEQEWHALPALMVAEQLRGCGYAVSYLGANSSAQHLVRHVHELGPRAVLLSSSLSAFLPVVRRQVEAVRETGTPVLVGGAAFDAEGRRAEALGATGYAASGLEAAEVLGRLPAAVTPAPPLTHPGADEAFVVYGDREGLADEVERMLLSTLATVHAEPFTADDRSWLRVLDDQMTHLVGAVAGALVAEDPVILAEALEWAETVLRYRNAPEEVGPALRQALYSALHDVPVAASMLDRLQRA